jgi:thiol:disulfide interchange protein DsbD
MYLSAGWLLWVLAQQSSSELLAVAIVGIILVAFAAWCYELARTGSGGWRYVSATLALAALATALIAPWRLPAQAAGAPASATSTDGDWQRFDAARVSELVAAGHPVFVVFTADWCVTCKVNEHVAIDNDAVEQLFRDKGVIRVKADWTRSDPAISAELARRGRGGVPLYLWYRPGVATPEILPQVLTPGLLQSLAGALDRATPRAST